MREVKGGWPGSWKLTGRSQGQTQQRNNNGGVRNVLSERATALLLKQCWRSTCLLRQCPQGPQIVHIFVSAQLSKVYLGVSEDRAWKYRSTWCQLGVPNKVAPSWNYIPGKFWNPHLLVCLSALHLSLPLFLFLHLCFALCQLIS